jgi:hypothetical protein
VLQAVAALLELQAQLPLGHQALVQQLLLAQQAPAPW